MITFNKILEDILSETWEYKGEVVFFEKRKSQILLFNTEYKILEVINEISSISLSKDEVSLWYSGIDYSNYDMLLKICKRMK